MNVTSVVLFEMQIDELESRVKHLSSEGALKDAVIEAALAFRDHCELINYRPLTYQRFKDALDALVLEELEPNDYE